MDIDELIKKYEQHLQRLSAIDIRHVLRDLKELKKFMESQELSRATIANAEKTYG
jgi:hypothetical protein